MAKRYCKCGCGHAITGHPNKKFLNKRHKDNYWNRVKPRGYGLRKYSIEPEDIANDLDFTDCYN